MNLGIRLSVAALWVLSLACLVSGSVTGHHSGVHHSHWGLYLSAAAAAGTVWIAVDRLVKSVSALNAQETADAVGAALHELLTSEERREASPRRDT